MSCTAAERTTFQHSCTVLSHIILCSLPRPRFRSRASVYTTGEVIDMSQPNATVSSKSSICHATTFVARVITITRFAFPAPSVVPSCTGPKKGHGEGLPRSDRQSAPPHRAPRQSVQDTVSDLHNSVNGSQAVGARQFIGENKTRPPPAIPRTREISKQASHPDRRGLIEPEIKLHRISKPLGHPHRRGMYSGPPEILLDSKKSLISLS